MAYDKQVYWEDVEVGQEIPALVKRPTKTQLLAWGGTVDDWNPMHVDHEVAHRAGYREPIVFGPLVVSFLEQMLTSWMGVEGWLNKITARHSAPAYPDEDVICKGKITNKYVKDGEHYVELQIQADYPDVKAGTAGSAIITLPSKAQARTLPSAEPMPDPQWRTTRLGR